MSFVLLLLCGWHSANISLQRIQSGSCSGFVTTGILNRPSPGSCGSAT